MAKRKPGPRKHSKNLSMVVLCIAHKKFIELVFKDGNRNTGAFLKWHS